MNYRSIFIQSASVGDSLADTHGIIYVCGVPTGVKGEGYFVSDSDGLEMREGVDFLAQFPVDCPDEDIIKKIKELGLESHLSPEFR